jgi:hypothetical protein
MNLRQYITPLMLAMLLASCSQQKDPFAIDESYTMGYNDNRPFGGDVFYRLAGKSFFTIKPTLNLRPFTNWYRSHVTEGHNYNGTVYLLISPRIVSYKQETDYMRSFVKEGNTLLVVADEITEELAGSFGINIHGPSMMNMMNMQDTRVKMIKPDLIGGSYFYYPLNQWLTAESDVTADTLALNENKQPALIRATFGKGQLIFATNARALSNYFLLSKNNQHVALALLSWLPAYPNAVVWDDFYRRNQFRRPENSSIFSAIFAVEPLRWAFWILITAALLWVASNMRRRQKMIPVIKPNQNTTVEFTQTIARLYFNNKDNRNIARKMVAYFNDHLRTRYYMPERALQQELAATLTAKTGMPAADSEQLASMMHEVLNGSAEVTDIFLLKLNHLMQSVTTKS